MFTTLYTWFYVFPHVKVLSSVYKQRSITLVKPPAVQKCLIWAFIYDAVYNQTTHDSAMRQKIGKFYIWRNGKHYSKKKKREGDVKKHF